MNPHLAVHLSYICGECNPVCSKPLNNGMQVLLYCRSHKKCVTQQQSVARTTGPIKNNTIVCCTAGNLKSRVMWKVIPFLCAACVFINLVHMTQFFIFLHKFTGKIKNPDSLLYWQRIFHLNVSSNKTIFAIPEQCFYMILKITYCISPYPVRFGKFCFNESLNMFVTLPMFKSETHETWQIQYHRSHNLTTG